MNECTFHLQALSDIWMGGPKRSAEIKDTRLNEKSLLGALRWWTEAIIRAAGGFACDPTDGKMRCEAKRHCLACDIFGCEGLSKRFALSIRERAQNNDAIPGSPSEFRHRPCHENDSFILSFDFFHPQFPETHKAVLMNSALILFNYGSIGGRIGFKPPGLSSKKNAFWHRNFGLVYISKEPPRATAATLATIKEKSDECLDSFEKDRNAKLKTEPVIADQFWPNFNYFFFYNPKYGKIELEKLSYKNINESVLGLIQVGPKKWKHKSLPPMLKWQEWLRGNEFQSDERQSKRLFVFSDSRIWGWARDENMLNTIIPEMASCFGKPVESFATGKSILNDILGE